jgi:hypothetical protein
MKSDGIKVATAGPASYLAGVAEGWPDEYEVGWLQFAGGTDTAPHRRPPQQPGSANRPVKSRIPK